MVLTPEGDQPGSLPGWSPQVPEVLDLRKETMSRQDFIVSVQVRRGVRKGATTSVELAFDPDDIHDAALASEVRGLARRALVKAGLRRSNLLGEK